MQPGDKPVLLDLWQEVFGDGADYAAPCLDIFAGEGNVLVADVHGRRATTERLRLPVAHFHEH